MADTYQTADSGLTQAQRLTTWPFCCARILVRLLCIRRPDLAESLEGLIQWHDNHLRPWINWQGRSLVGYSVEICG